MRKRLFIYFFLLSSTIHAQTLSPKASVIRQKVLRLRANAKITIIPDHGEEQFGRLISCGSTSFTFVDVDAKANSVASFEEVKSLRSGYGGYNPITHKHVNRRKQAVVIVAVAGALGTLVALAASAN